MNKRKPGRPLSGKPRKRSYTMTLTVSVMESLRQYVDRFNDVNGTAMSLSETVDMIVTKEMAKNES